MIYVLFHFPKGKFLRYLTCTTCPWLHHRSKCPPCLWQSMFKWVYNVSWRYFFVINKNIYICIKAGIILNYCLLTYQQGYHPVPFSIMFNIFPENAIFAKYDICSHWFSIPCLQSGRQFFNVVCYYHGTVERHSVRKSLERAINIISLMKWGGEGILGVPVLLRFLFFCNVDEGKLVRTSFL